MSDLLLDTCALLWLAEGIELPSDARKGLPMPILTSHRSVYGKSAAWYARNESYLPCRLSDGFDQRWKRPKPPFRNFRSRFCPAHANHLGSPPSDPADRIIIATRASPA